MKLRPLSLRLRFAGPVLELMGRVSEDADVGAALDVLAAFRLVAEALHERLEHRPAYATRWGRGRSGMKLSPPPLLSQVRDALG